MDDCTRCHVVQKIKNKVKKSKKNEIQEYKCNHCSLVLDSSLFTNKPYPSEDERICMTCMTSKDQYQYLVSQRFWPMKKLSSLQKSKVIREVMKDHKIKLYQEKLEKQKREYQERIKFLLECYG